MRIIADSYRNQYEAGIAQGIQQGITQIAINMIKQELDLKLISLVY